MPESCFPNLQVVTHASHVRSQHLFALSLSMNGIHRRQFDHAHLDLLLTSNLNTHVLNICHVKLMQITALALEQKRFDLRSLSPALRNLWLLPAVKI